MSDEVLVRMRDLAWEKKQRKAAEARAEKFKAALECSNKTCERRGARVAELTARVGELEAALHHAIKQAEVYKRDGPRGMKHKWDKMQSIADQALAGSPAPVGEAERRLAKAAMVFLSTRTSADLENLRMKGDALAKARETGEREAEG